ncbi:translocation protein SEC62 isoform X1 [Stomoxys calcitrans]|uniref:translocation protein SEC62 isoform X1 n=1 Tax=Stomoxys calcitrans TaxID=35570 RepID=UPI0027E23CC5|nr:translocation protein SEC62 isoform X1 [Stomoxys calcitrans]
MSTEDLLEDDGYNVVPEDEPEYTGPGENQELEKPSKDELKVAKWMKKNVKTKKTKFLSHNVEYFTSNKAIDALMKSKFVEGSSPLFTTREQAVDFLDIMLEHKFFHRAKKVPISIEELRTTTKATTKEEGKKEGSADKSPSTSAAAAAKKDEKRELESNEAGEQSANNGAGSDENGGQSASGEKKEKKKRKIRLDMHPEQVFVDGSEAYVWIFDPIPIHYWIYGLVLLLGAIGICMFPLWPPMLRKGVYYLSLAAAGFLVFILALTVLRMIIFTIVWAVTGAKLHFWIFPNLTEDVGFFASFCPLYESKYVSGEDDDDKKSKKSKSKSKKSKEKDSDLEDNDNEDVPADTEPLEPEKIEEIKEHDADVLLRHRKVAGSANEEEESHSGSSSANEAAQDSESAKCSQNHSESESDGKDYEIISSSEVQNVK